MYTRGKGTLIKDQRLNETVISQFKAVIIMITTLFFYPYLKASVKKSGTTFGPQSSEKAR